MPQRIESWSIPGADHQPIIGDTHCPDIQPRGVIVIANGFKGYKDYGMFPRFASECAASGLIVHRFNFSHSGMTNNIDTFERPDLFEKDTWNKQVFDLCKVIEHATAGSLRDPGAPPPLPLYLLGHSRGGVTVLLTLGRASSKDNPTRSVALPPIAGAITLAAPSYTNPFSPEQSAQLLEQGYLDSPSSRTGQALRIGKAFLQEQLDDPQGHDLLALSRNTTCPVLIIHGENDPTVPARCAHDLQAAIGPHAQVKLIPKGDHVFNTPNPLPPEMQPSEQLSQVIEEVKKVTCR